MANTCRQYTTRLTAPVVDDHGAGLLAPLSLLQRIKAFLVCLYGFQPRQGRKKIAHGVSRGERPGPSDQPRQGRKKRRLVLGNAAAVFFRLCRGWSLEVISTHGLRRGLFSCAPAGAAETLHASRKRCRQRSQTTLGSSTEEGNKAAHGCAASSMVEDETTVARDREHLLARAGRCTKPARRRAHACDERRRTMNSMPTRPPNAIMAQVEGSGAGLKLRLLTALPPVESA